MWVTLARSVLHRSRVRSRTLVASAFLGALLTIKLTQGVAAVLFILATCALVVTLSLFLREVFLAASFGRRLLR